jgi:hypothetical protein
VTFSSRAGISSIVVEAEETQVRIGQTMREMSSAYQNGDLWSSAH